MNIRKLKKKFKENKTFISNYEYSVMIGPSIVEKLCEPGDVCEFIRCLGLNPYSYSNQSENEFYNHTKKLYFIVEGFPATLETPELVRLLFS